MWPRLSSALVVVSLVLVIAAAGCSPANDRKPVFPVSGKATFKGEAMAGARVTFHPIGGTDRRAVRGLAEVDQDGVFRMTTYVKEDGAPAGEYSVTIYWPGRPAKGKADDPELEANDLPPDRLKRVYASATTTKLRAVVREQPNTIDFNLP